MFPSHLSVWSMITPRGFVSPIQWLLRLAPPFPSHRRLIYPLPTVSVARTVSAPGTPSGSSTCRQALRFVVVFVGLKDAWGYLVSSSALLLSAPFSLGITMSPVFFAVSSGPWLFCLETVALEKDLVSWLLSCPPAPPLPLGF